MLVCTALVHPQFLTFASPSTWKGGDMGNHRGTSQWCVSVFLRPRCPNLQALLGYTNLDPVFRLARTHYRLPQLCIGPAFHHAECPTPSLVTRSHNEERNSKNVGNETRGSRFMFPPIRLLYVGQRPKVTRNTKVATTRVGHVHLPLNEVVPLRNTNRSYAWLVRAAVASHS